LHSTLASAHFILLVFFVRVKSFNELNLMIKNREFSQLFSLGTKLPKPDVIRVTLKVIDINRLKLINPHIVNENRFLKTEQLRIYGGL